MIQLLGLLPFASLILAVCAAVVGSRGAAWLALTLAATYIALAIAQLWYMWAHLGTNAKRATVLAGLISEAMNAAFGALFVGFAVLLAIWVVRQP